MARIDEFLPGFRFHIGKIVRLEVVIILIGGSRRAEIIHACRAIAPTAAGHAIVWIGPEICTVVAGEPLLQEGFVYRLYIRVKAPILVVDVQVDVIGFCDRRVAACHAVVQYFAHERRILVAIVEFEILIARDGLVWIDKISRYCKGLFL